MRISELSRRSGIPIPSIKYYLREGLLTAGRPTGANQAEYGDDHITRLRLIRALIDIGALSVAAAREVIVAVDQPDLPLTHVFGIAQYAISRSDVYSTTPSEASRDRIDAAIETRGWTVTPDAPARVGAANVLDAFEQIGHPELTLILEDYLVAAEAVARADLEAVGRQSDITAMAETVVAGTVLGDALFAALRRLAQEHVAIELYAIDHESDPFGRGIPSAADNLRSQS